MKTETKISLILIIASVIMFNVFGHRYNDKFESKIKVEKTKK